MNRRARIRPPRLARFAVMAVMAAMAVAGPMATAGCRSGLPAPAEGPKAAPSEYVEVPYPPPAGNAEIVPPRPEGKPVWIDGQWSGFAGERWTWEGGGWVVPPPDATFTRWSVEYRKDGRLYFAPASWRAKNGQPVPPPAFLARARRGDPGKGGTLRADDETLAPMASASASATSAPRNARPTPLLDDASLPAPALSPEAPLPGPPADAGAVDGRAASPADAGANP